MENPLLQLIEEVIKTLSRFKVAVVTHSEVTAKEREKIIKTQESLDTREAEIAKREEAVKGIENVLALKEEAIRLMDDAKKAMDAAKLRAQEVDRIALENVKRNNEQLDEIRKGNELLKRGWATLDAAKQNFAEEKKSFTTDIAAGLVKLAERK